MKQRLSARPWMSEYRSEDVAIGRARERQLIAEAERHAEDEREARRVRKHTEVAEYAAYRAKTRARLGLSGTPNGDVPDSTKSGKGAR